MSEESDRVSLSLCLSSRYAVTHSSPSTPRFATVSLLLSLYLRLGPSGPGLRRE